MSLFDHSRFQRSLGKNEFDVFLSVGKPLLSAIQRYRYILHKEYGVLLYIEQNRDQKFGKCPAHSKFSLA